MTTRIGINGFGRIGRTFLRAALANDADIEVVAVNDLTDVTTLADLLEWDSVAGHLDGVSAQGDHLDVRGTDITVFSQRDPSAIPWGEVGADVVIESTGLFTDTDAARAHLKGWCPQGHRLGPRVRGRSRPRPRGQHGFPRCGGP